MTKQQTNPYSLPLLYLCSILSWCGITLLTVQDVKSQDVAVHGILATTKYIHMIQTQFRIRKHVEHCLSRKWRETVILCRPQRRYHI